MLKEPMLDENAPWKQRFCTPKIFQAQVAGSNPLRGLAISDRESGVIQLYAWDLSSGQLRRLTDHPDGIFDAWIDPAGQHVYYLQDTKGDELGHIVRLPFAGGEPEDITPNLTPFTLRGFHFSCSGNLLAFTPVNADGFQVYCMDLGPAGELSAPRQIYQSAQEAWESIPSFGGELLALQSTERAKGQRLYSSLVLDAASGELVGELWDGPGHSVEPFAFAPLPGDFRLLATTTLSGFQRPVIWNPRTGERNDLALDDLQGDVILHDWSPDGRRILFNQLDKASQQLYLYDLAEGELVHLRHPQGAFGYGGGSFGGKAYFRPGGEILALWQDANHPVELIALDAETGVKQYTALAAGAAPAGRPWRSVSFTSSDGQEVQGWLGVPEGEGPFPTILAMHGGPHFVQTLAFSPDSQVWLDHGFAFLTINFRGSTTFGRAFQEQIWGDIGHWELEDMASARRWLIEQGIARPDAVLLTGGSYGGFLTLLGLGKQPDLWAGGMALVGIADWAVNYEDASDALKGAFRAWFKGSPQEKPEQYRTSSPITYAENVRAPLLVIQGYNDSRTAARQMEMYEAKMKSLGKPIEIVWFDAGHGVGKLEEILGFRERMLRFAYDTLGVL